MPRVTWTLPALDSLKQIRSFLNSQNPASAQKAVLAIRSYSKTLLNHPYAGRQVRDLPDEYREYIVPFGSSGYVLRYRIVPTGIVILAIRHQKQSGYPSI